MLGQTRRSCPSTPEIWNLPTGYHVQDVWVFVDATVIHYNYRVWHRKGIHGIHQATDKTSKSPRVERALNNVHIEDTLVTQCWKDRISAVNISYRDCLT
jgi:hypothetical protein